MTLLWFAQCTQYVQLLDSWVISRFFAVVKKNEVNNLVSILCVQLLSCIWLFATPWTVVHQVPLHYFCLFACIWEYLWIKFKNWHSWVQVQSYMYLHMYLQLRSREISVFYGVKLWPVGEETSRQSLLSPNMGSSEKQLFIWAARWSQEIKHLLILLLFAGLLIHLVLALSLFSVLFPFNLTLILLGLHSLRKLLAHILLLGQSCISKKT